MKGSTEGRSVLLLPWVTLLVLTLVSHQAFAQANDRQARERFDRGAVLEQEAARLLKSGDRKGAQDKLEEALRAYRGALGQAPADPDPALRMGTILLFEKRCKEALPVLERTAEAAFGRRLQDPSSLSPQAVAGRPKFRELLLLVGRCRLAEGPDEMGFRALAAVGNLTPDVHFLVGRRYLKAGRKLQALTHLSAYLKHHQEDLDVLEAVANLQLRLKRLDDAAASYQRVLDKRPEDLSALKNLAVVQFRRQRYKAAIDMFRRVLARAPSDAAARFNLGVCLARGQQHAQAIVEFKKVLQQKPKLARAWQRVGLSLQALKRSRQALEALSTALRYDRDHVPTYVAMAEIHRDARRFTECISVLKRGLTLNPGQAKLQAPLGACYRDAKDYRRALSVHLDALRSSPRDGRLHAEAGHDYLALGRLEEAAAAYRRSRKWSESSTEVRDALATTVARLGVRALQKQDTQRAIDHLKEAVSLRPNNAIDLCNLGLAYLAAGQPGPAERVLLDARRRQPGHPEVSTAYGRLLLEQDKVQMAVRALADDSKSARPSAGRLHLLGLALLRADRTDDAVQTLRRVLPLRPHDARVRFDLGRALVRAQKYSEAVDVLTELDDEPAAGLDERAVALVRGYALYRNRNYAAATRRLRRIEVPSGEEKQLVRSAWLRHGDELANRNQWRSALAAFQKASELGRTVATRANVAAVEYQLGKAKRAYRTWRSLAKRHRLAALHFNIAIYFDDHVGNEAVAYRWYLKNVRLTKEGRRSELQAILRRKRDLFGFRP